MITVCSECTEHLDRFDAHLSLRKVERISVAICLWSEELKQDFHNVLRHNCASD